MKTCHEAPGVLGQCFPGYTIAETRCRDGKLKEYSQKGSDTTQGTTEEGGVGSMATIARSGVLRLT
jgi:hypothetical protein